MSTTPNLTMKTEIETSQFNRLCEFIDGSSYEIVRGTLAGKAFAEFYAKNKSTSGKFDSSSAQDVLVARATFPNKTPNKRNGLSIVQPSGNTVEFSYDPTETAIVEALENCRSLDVPYEAIPSPDVGSSATEHRSDFNREYTISGKEWDKIKGFFEGKKRQGYSVEKIPSAWNQPEQYEITFNNAGETSTIAHISFKSLATSIAGIGRIPAVNQIIMQYDNNDPEIETIVSEVETTRHEKPKKKSKSDTTAVPPANCSDFVVLDNLEWNALTEIIRENSDYKLKTKNTGLLGKTAYQIIQTHNPSINPIIGEAHAESHILDYTIAPFGFAPPPMETEFSLHLDPNDVAFSDMVTQAQTLVRTNREALKDKNPSENTKKKRFSDNTKQAGVGAVLAGIGAAVYSASDNASKEEAQQSQDNAPDRISFSKVFATTAVILGVAAIVDAMTGGKARKWMTELFKSGANGLGR